MRSKKNNTEYLFSEKLYVPWWYVICAAIVVGLLGYELGIALQNTKYHLLCYIPLSLLALWFLWANSQSVIAIDNQHTIYVSKATIPSQFISRAYVVEPEMKSSALGKQSDPSAYIHHKGWVKSMVLLVLNDPADQTPYWIFSTRHPEKFISALPSSIKIVDSSTTENK